LLVNVTLEGQQDRRENRHIGAGDVDTVCGGKSNRKKQPMTTDDKFLDTAHNAHNPYNTVFLRRPAAEPAF
jgi:hypothetical protein